MDADLASSLQSLSLQLEEILGCLGLGFGLLFGFLFGYGVFCGRH